MASKILVCFLYSFQCLGGTPHDLCLYWHIQMADVSLSEHPQNMRIHFYGVQGSGTVFPTRQERLKQQKMMGHELLEKVFQELTGLEDSQGNLSGRIEDILGAPLSPQVLHQFQTRLSLAEPRVYGGWTTCVWIETADGYDIVLDCGSGFRNCAKTLQEKWDTREERHLHLFGTHSHYDHTEGFDQAVVCFDPRNTIHVYGNRQFLHGLDRTLGIFTKHVESSVHGVHTPLFYALMPARFRSCEIRGEAPTPLGSDKNLLAHHIHDVHKPFEFGQTQIDMIPVSHPAPCLAYRLSRAGTTFVFCTDHELFHGPTDDPRYKSSRQAENHLATLSDHVDLLYRDGQYFRVEYDGQKGIGTGSPVSRVGWGHSCVEDVMEMAEQCQVRRTLIGHHDPNRDWSERNWIDAILHRRSDQTGLGFELAQAETIIDL